MLRRPRPMLRCTVALVALVSLGALPAAHGDEPAFALRPILSELVRKEMSAKDVIGLSVAVVEDQKISWTQGFGQADKERGVAATADTLYSVGALSQLLTATAVLARAERGEFGLDEPIRKYLPGFSIRSRAPRTAGITVRQILSHHAGLPGMHFRDMWTPNPEPLAAFVARLKDETAPYPPDYVYSPSYPGYDLLGRALELQCGKPFSTCMQEQLLAPLGMARSTFDATRADRARLAIHYWQGKPLASQTVRDVPAAGLVTSAHELAQFARMLLAEGQLDGRTILKARSVREMLRAQNANVALDLDRRVGLPWRLSGVHLARARTVAWLSNESPFSRGRVVLVPEQKLAIIVLSNCSGSTEAVEHISERMAELILEARKLPVAATEHATMLTPAGASPKREDIVGHYATHLGLISVSNSGGLRARMLGKTIELKPQPEGLLAPEYRLLGLIPIPISVLKEARVTTARVGGRAVGIAYFRNAAHLLGERIQPVKLSEAWLRRLGDYRAVERDPLLELVKFGSVNLAYIDGILQFRYRVPGWLGLQVNVPVRPVSDTELVIEGSGWLMGESVQVTQHNGKDVLRYSGYEFQRVGRP